MADNIGEEIDEVNEAVRDFCARNGLLGEGDRILLAVSGGPDSTAMLHLFLGFRDEFNLTLGMAHVHHGLRGSDADEDQRFVEGMARELGIPLFSTRLRVASLRKKGESTEEAARRLRFRYLFEIVEHEGFDTIAAGHTLDDNIETVLYRLAKGTGPGGAAGILPKSGRLIHPLLEMSKKRLLTYLEARGIPYRLDRTNDDIGIPRNRIRHEILPVMHVINCRYRECFGRFLELLRGENSFLDRMTSELLDSVLEMQESSGLRVHHERFMRYDMVLRRRMVMKILEKLAGQRQPSLKPYLPHRILDLVVNATPGGNRILYQNKELRIRKAYDWLVFEKRVVDTRGGGYLYYVRDVNESLYIKEIGKKLFFSIENGGFFEKGLCRGDAVYLDRESVSFPLVVRSRRPGDRIELHGVGHKKLKDLFIDQKVDTATRASIPVLESNGTVIAVFCSLYGKDNRVADGCRVTSGTAHVLVGELQDWKN
jgi:tRNA(Ile)-lysidine synthase